MTRPQAPIPPELVRPFLSGDLPAVEGEVRSSPEDFEVEELPIYLPEGEGEHLYLWIEKEGIPTHEAVRRIAKRLKVSQRKIGTAGLKDARAKTRQWISVQGASVEDASRAEGEQLKVLEAKLHKNKLKTGHLRGNRFRIWLRGSAAHEEAARACLARLSEGGVANWFGLQRFGWERSTHLCGEAVVRGDAEELIRLVLLGPEGSVLDHPRVLEGREHVRAGDYASAQRSYPGRCAAERALCRALAEGRAPQEAVGAIPHRQRELYVSGYQSLLFNLYLRGRIEEGGPEGWSALSDGDVATIHRNGASFQVQNAAEERERVETFGISPSGPLFGRRLLRPLEGSAALAREEALLAEHAAGLDADLWTEQGFGRPPLGSRRLLRIPLGEVLVERAGDDLRIGFDLPKGCYATAVLEELFKRPID